MKQSSIHSDRSSTFSNRPPIQVVIVSMACNLFLAVLKLTIGLLTDSAAITSDGIHSSCDILTNVAVLIGIRLAHTEQDLHHPYGHERFESLTALILSFILLSTGFCIGSDAIQKMYHWQSDGKSSIPLFAIYPALCSIILKEIMFWYTRHHAISSHSSALMADAWHQRTDSLSSIAALIGIIGAKLGAPICDVIASLTISIMICLAAISIFADAANQLVDRSCNRQIEEKLRTLVLSQPDVQSISMLRTRVFGNRIYADVTLQLSAVLTIRDGCSISEHICSAVYGQIPEIKEVLISLQFHESNLN